MRFLLFFVSLHACFSRRDAIHQQTISLNDQEVESHAVDDDVKSSFADEKSGQNPGDEVDFNRAGSLVENDKTDQSTSFQTSSSAGEHDTGGTSSFSFGESSTAGGVASDRHGDGTSASFVETAEEGENIAEHDLDEFEHQFNEYFASLLEQEGGDSHSVDEWFHQEFNAALGGDSDLSRDEMQQFLGELSEHTQSFLQEDHPECECGTSTLEVSHEDFETAAPRDVTGVADSGSESGTAGNDIHIPITTQHGARSTSQTVARQLKVSSSAAQEHSSTSVVGTGHSFGAEISSTDRLSQETHRISEGDSHCECSSSYMQTFPG